MAQLESIFFTVIMIGLIVMFSLVFIFLIGWLIFMGIDFIKDHFKKRRHNNGYEGKVG